MAQTRYFPDAVPTLLGDMVDLRELTEADVPAWFARASDPESAVLAGDPIPESVELGVHWLQRHHARFHQHAGMRWAIVPQGSTESVGTIGLAITSNAAHSAELGIVIGRASWGNGIGTAAAHVVTGYAVSTLGVAALHADVLQRNRSSRRLLENVDFHLLRSIPGDPHSATDVEHCFLLVLSRQNRTSAEQRRASVWR
jgi:ribosomal-protein-alanine N-acetyltransferase